MSGARLAIRAATAADHEQLDGLFDHFDLADRSAYGRFLVAHAAALAAVEDALDQAGAERVIPDWVERRRGALIRDDLAALGLETPGPLPFAALAGDAECWGAAYVVEGSRLGGAMLARRVADGLPRSYLAAPQPKGAWRGFTTALDAALPTANQVARASTCARAAFALFASAGRSQLEHLGR